MNVKCSVNALDSLNYHPQMVTQLLHFPQTINMLSHPTDKHPYTDQDTQKLVISVSSNLHHTVTHLPAHDGISAENIEPENFF
jgi:hypothetical protein